MALSHPDFLVVRAGAAGGIVAKELATAGFRIVVLEQGPWLHERDFRHDELWVTKQHALTNDPRRQPNTRRTTEAEQAMLQPTVSYGQMVGSGSVHFTGNYWRFHETDFVERSRTGPVETATGSDVVGAPAAGRPPGFRTIHGKTTAHERSQAYDRRPQGHVRRRSPRPRPPPSAAPTSIISGI